MTLAAFMRGWLSVQRPSAPAGRTRISGCIYARREDAARLPRADRSGSESRGSRRRGGHRLQPGGPRARGLGRWGYAAAVADAKARSGATQLADVRADTTFFNILFLYDEACTRVTAKAVR